MTAMWTLPSKLAQSGIFALIGILVFSPMLWVLAALDTNLTDEIKVGDMIPAIDLVRMDGTKVNLAKEEQSSHLVVVLLRGYPGYQCPFCSQQVADILKNARKIKAKAKLVFVYPGQEFELSKKANQFAKQTSLPEKIDFLLDPGFAWTNSVGLRWEADAETSYPSTLIFDKSRKLTWSKISREHGDRTTGSEIVDLLNELR